MKPAQKLVVAVSGCIPCRWSRSFNVQGRQVKGRMVGGGGGGIAWGGGGRGPDLHPGLLMQVCDVELPAWRMGHQLVMFLQNLVEAL